MNINESIFKAYDVRGIYPAEINEEVAYRIGKATQLLTKAKKVVIGHDARLSSPALTESVVKGLVEQGVDVDLAGLVSTDAIYFAVGSLGYDAGAIITASHNPKEYNGIKVVERGSNILTGEILKPAVLKNDWPKINKIGKIAEVDILTPYVEFAAKLIDPNKIKPLKVAIDAGNGVAGIVMEKLIKLLPLQVVPLYFEPDGNFPNHLANPLEPENTAQLRKVVKEQQCDLGIAFDGDGDRVFFIDEQGNFIRGDLTLLFLAKTMLVKYPGAKITYNLICSHAVPEFIAQWGGQPIITRVGHYFIKEVMKKEDAVFGGEISSHFFYRDHFYTESAYLTVLLFLTSLSQQLQPLSQIMAGFSKYYISPELNTRVADVKAKLEEIKAKYQNGKMSLMDGVTVEFNESPEAELANASTLQDTHEVLPKANTSWWFNVRPSNTEPLLRLTVEAKSKELLAEKIEELMKIIKS